MNGFDDFLGSKNVVKGLMNMIDSQRISHAYIFDGSLGTGKKTLAKIFAKALQCRGEGVRPCGKCPSCKGIDSGDSPDVFFISSEKQTIGVDVVRDEIIDRSSVKPYMSKYRIFVITQGDKLTEQAQNALLKTIEEPPSYGIYIILTTNYKALLETILSRCVLLRLSPLSTELIERELKKRGACKDSEAGVIAGASGGSLGQALKLSEDEDFFVLREKAISAVEKTEKCDFMGLYDIMEDMLSVEKRLGELLELMYMFYRDLIICKTAGRQLVIQKDYIGVIEDLCRKMSLKRLLRGEKALTDAKANIEMNVNKQLCLEQMLFEMKRSDSK